MPLVRFYAPLTSPPDSLESQNFFLLHLSLFREYLDLEFHSLLDLAPGELSFDYSLERIIDDFILLAIFVGNDFLPHLPDFHINENALERLFEIYKEVLPKAGGYLVTQGTIDMVRLQLVFDELAKGEMETFTKEHADTTYFRGKQAKFREPKAPDARAGVSHSLQGKTWLICPSHDPGAAVYVSESQSPGSKRPTIEWRTRHHKCQQAFDR
jgi:5'-3' exonuclease